MLYLLLFFSSIFLFKSIILTEFYSNVLLFSLYPLELAALSFDNNNIDLIIKWVLVGFMRNEKDMKYIENIQIFHEYSIILSWTINFVLFMLYVLLRNYKKIDRYVFIEYFTKYNLIHFTGLFLWSSNIIVSNDIQNIFQLTLNMYLFNFITFWFSGLLFYFIYGDKIYFYRVKFKITLIIKII